MALRIRRRRIGMLAGLAVFLSGQSHLRGMAEPPDPARLKARVAGSSASSAPCRCDGVGGLLIAGLLNFPRVVAGRRWACWRSG